MKELKSVAVEAVKYYVEQEKEKKKRAMLHNTEEVLKHYISLLDSVESIETESLFLKSFTESRNMTEALIKHTNRCLDKLEERFPMEFNTLVYLYMDPDLIKVEWCERIETTAEKMNTSSSTVRRWRKDMVKELSVLLFGSDGLKFYWI